MLVVWMVRVYICIGIYFSRVRSTDVNYFTVSDLGIAILVYIYLPTYLPSRDFIE